MKRIKKYIFIAWVLIGIMICFATYFFWANNYTKLSFSIKNNDIYEVDKRAPSYVDWEDGYYMYFWVDFKRDTINYMRVNASNISDDNVRLSFTGTDGNWQPIVTVTDIPLKNGINDIKLENQKFEIAELFISGTDQLVVEEIQFRESIDEHPIKEAFPTIVLAMASYIFVSVIVAVFGRTKIQINEKC